MIPKVLTIAGSDSGGGAGIQADIKTFEEFNTFGLSTITSILSVNPMNRKSSVFVVPENVIASQLQTAFSGGKLSVKTGLLASPEAVQLTVAHLKKYAVTELVVDPVGAVKNNSELLQSQVFEQLKHALLPLATVVTPNLIEAQLLADMPPITTLKEMKQACIKIKALGPRYVVIKGGARFPGNDALDVLYDGKTFTIFTSPKITRDTNHGAGCSFAAALTAGLAYQRPIQTCIQEAKNFVHIGIQNGLYLNEHTGYIWHGASRYSS